MRANFRRPSRADNCCGRRTGGWHHRLISLRASGACSRRHRLAAWQAARGGHSSGAVFFDAHNHLQDDRFAGRHREIIAECRSVGVAKMVVNGSCEADWPLVARLAAEFPDMVIPSFGCHPWYLDELTPEWKPTLERCLDEAPGAVIGEIGIDRWMVENPDRWRAYLGAANGVTGPEREPTPMADQEAVFVWQLKLAVERGLPVSIHCLEAFGRLLELLREHWRPGQGFLLHSYGGPAEMVPAFAKLGGYFGFPGAHLQCGLPGTRCTRRGIACAAVGQGGGHHAAAGHAAGF